MKGIKPISFHIPFIAFIRGCSELPNALVAGKILPGSFFAGFAFRMLAAK
jgi:hypothetical protein